MNDLQSVLIPCYMLPMCRCCVLYDGHPRDKKKIDITVCLDDGTVLEVFKREPVASIKIRNVSNFNKIQIIRNNRGDLYYLIEADQELILLSSTDRTSNQEPLSIYRRFNGVNHYELCDPECSGQAHLKIQFQLSEEYIPFSNIQEAIQTETGSSESTASVISALKKKLTEAKYNLHHNEEAHKQVKKLRQRAIFLCHGDDKSRLKPSKPIVLFCNKKIIIQSEVKNEFREPMKNVCVLVHNTSCNSISYTTKVYEGLSTCPFYKELESREIKSNCVVSIVTVIPISEFKGTISGRIGFSVIVSYEMNDTSYVQSFGNVHLSAADVMGENFDVFSNKSIDYRALCIAMLSTTTKTCLCLKQMGLRVPISLSTIFGNELKMDIIAEGKIAIHRHSPHHVLHGMLIVFDDDLNNCNFPNEINYKIYVYTRSPSQVMALIHFLSDKIKLTLIVLTPNIQVTKHSEDFDENIDDRESIYDFTQCAESFQKQASITLKYLNDCRAEMSKSNNLNNTNVKYDLLALGTDRFLKFKNEMVAEAKNGFEYFITSNQTSYVEETMEID